MLMHSSHPPLPMHAAWHVCPRCGGQPIVQGQDPFQCQACNYTHHFGPCTAVGGIVTDPNGLVLLLIRGRDPGKGKFGLPGGFVDQQETVEDALRREVFEEVRLRVVRWRYLCSFPNEYHYCGVIVPVTDLFFTVVVDSFEGMQPQDGEIAGWHYSQLGESDLDNMAFHSNRLALQQYLAVRDAGDEVDLDRN
jgi:NAD+ diphosphatase